MVALPHQQYEPKREKVVGFQTAAAAVKGSELADPGAESAVVGAVLNAPTLYHSLAEQLQPGDFHTAFCALSWYEFGEIFEENGALDVVTVASKLKKYSADTLGATGDVETFVNLRLSQLKNSVPSMDNIEHYAGIVRAAAARIRLADTGAKIAKIAANTALSVDEINTQAESLLYKATERSSVQNSHISGAVDSYVNDLLDPNALTGAIPLQFADLDLKLGGGLMPGELVVLGGNDGMGKTSMLLSLVLNVLLGGYTVVHGSGEVDRVEMIRRFLTMLTGVTDHQMRSKQIPVELASLIPEKARMIKGLSHYIVDQYPRFKTNHLRREANKIIAQGGSVDLIVADGLWLMEADDELDARKPRPEQVAYITASLVKLAKDFHCPVVAVQQYHADLYKSNMTGKIRRPTNFDLAESAACRRDADLIWLMHRPSFYQADATDENGTELVWGKARHDSSIRKGSFTPLDFRQQYSMYCGFTEADKDRFDTMRVNF